jgi:hypothetical protein
VVDGTGPFDVPLGTAGFGIVGGDGGVGTDDCGVACDPSGGSAEGAAAPGSGAENDGVVVPVGEGVDGTVVAPGLGTLVSGDGCVLGVPFESIPMVPPGWLGSADDPPTAGPDDPIPGVTEVGAPLVVPEGAVTPNDDWPGCPIAELIGGGGGITELGDGTPGVTGAGTVPDGPTCATDELGDGIEAGGGRP